MMSELIKLSILESFSELEDPRADDQRKKHNLLEILVIAICGMLCAADDWVTISQFGREKEDWFRKFLELPNGIPSHDTFRRVFSLLDPGKFVEVFTHWTRAISEASQGDVVAIDGKTLRRSFDRSHDQLAVHLVNAWSCANGVTLGQVQVDRKSNEITAIPKLLEILDLKGCIVTIDAMGCQKDIAEKIREQDADYVLALKGNHGDLHEEVELFFESQASQGFTEFSGTFHETVDADHGRIETRRSYLTSDIAWTGADAEWKDLKSIGMVEAHREINGKTTTERRFYLTSLEGSAEKFGDAVRSHWQIENNMHWVLDVVFREDESRARTKNSAQNLSLLRKIALNLLKKESSAKVGIKCKRLKAGWSERYLLKILAGAA